MRSRQVKEAVVAEDPFGREALRPSPREFVPTGQEATCAAEQELIEPPVRPRHGPVREVAMPAGHHPVDLAHYVRPRSLIAGA